LSIVAPYGPNEQKRFDDKLDEACRNLSKHYPLADEHCGNVVMLRIPETTSLEAAESYARNGSLQSYPNICAAFLFRTQVCANGVDIALGHQVIVVPNPTASWSIRHYAPAGMAFELLLGYVVGASPFDAPLLPPYHPPASLAHSFDRQHHHYVRDYLGDTIPAEEPPKQIGLSCQWTFLGKKRIDIRFTNTVLDRELVLL
jgi:hypothetical protein